MAQTPRWFNGAWGTTGTLIPTNTAAQSARSISGYDNPIVVTIEGNTVYSGIPPYIDADGWGRLNIPFTANANSGAAIGFSFSPLITFQAPLSVSISGSHTLRLEYQHWEYSGLRWGLGLSDSDGDVRLDDGVAPPSTVVSDALFFGGGL